MHPKQRAEDLLEEFGYELFFVRGHIEDKYEEAIEAHQAKGTVGSYWYYVDRETWLAVGRELEKLIELDHIKSKIIE